MSIPSNKLLERLLDYTALKQKVISQNISNAETIGYKRRDIEFKELFHKSLEENSDKRNKLSEFKVVLDKNTENLSGINNVDVNKEMADMAENTIMFNFAARKLSAYFKSLQSVIKGGGQ